MHIQFEINNKKNMNNKILKFTTIVAILILISASCTKKQSSDKFYGVKSGKIVYKTVDMNGIKMNQTLWFDDYGRKECRETFFEGDMHGVPFSQHAMEVRIDSIVYSYSIDENDTTGFSKQVMKTVMPKEALDFIKVDSYSKELKQKLNFKSIGTEEVAGLKGDKYSITPFEGQSPEAAEELIAVHYRNVPLKLTMEDLNIEADKVELNINVDQKIFDIPEGYTVVDESEMRRQRQMME